MYSVDQWIEIRVVHRRIIQRVNKDKMFGRTGGLRDPTNAHQVRGKSKRTFDPG